MGADLSLAPVGPAVWAREVYLGEVRLPQRTSPLSQRAGVTEDYRGLGLTYGGATQEVVPSREVESGVDGSEHIGTSPNTDPVACRNRLCDRVVVVPECLGFPTQEDAVLTADEVEHRIHDVEGSVSKGPAKAPSSFLGITPRGSLPGAVADPGPASYLSTLS